MGRNSKVQQAFDLILYGNLTKEDREILKHLVDQIRYWSYCTYQGMKQWCPEKKEELVDFLSDLEIDPYRHERRLRK